MMSAANRQRGPGQMRKALSQRFQVSYVGPDLRRRTVPNPFALLTFLRSEIPTDEISANPVMVHPHNTCRTVPERLPAAEIKELSALQPTKALIATAAEWGHDRHDRALLVLLASRRICDRGHDHRRPPTRAGGPRP